LENIASESPRFEDFPSATLYLDDLSEILGTLAKACRSIEVRAGDYKICDPAELDALASRFPKGQFGHSYLQGHDPYISIDLRTSGVSAYIPKDTLEQRGLVSKIRDIVQRGKKRKLHPGRLFSGPMHRTLLKFGFAEAGGPWRSMRGPHDLAMYLRPAPDHPLQRVRRKRRAAERERWASLRIANDDQQATNS